MEKLLNTDQVCDRLGIAPATLYRLLEKGQIKGAKVARLWRFRPSDIDAYLNQSHPETTAITRTAPPETAPEPSRPGDVDMGKGVWPDPTNRRPNVPHEVMADIKRRISPGGDLAGKTLHYIAMQYDLSATTMSRYMRVYGYMCRHYGCTAATIDNSNYCPAHQPAEETAEPLVLPRKPEPSGAGTANTPPKPDWLRVGQLVRWLEPQYADEYWGYPFHIIDVDTDDMGEEWMLQTPTSNWYLASSVEPVIKTKPVWATEGQWVRWRDNSSAPFPITDVDEMLVASSGFAILTPEGEWHDVGNFVPYNPAPAEVLRHSFAVAAHQLTSSLTGHDAPLAGLDPTPKSPASAILEAAEATDPADLSNGKVHEPETAPSPSSVAAVPDWAEDIFQAVSIYLEALNVYHTKLKEAAVLNYPDFKAELRQAEKSADEAYSLLQSSYAYASRQRRG